MSIQNNVESKLINAIKYQAAREEQFVKQIVPTRETNLSNYTPSYHAALAARQFATLANMVPFGIEPILSNTLAIFKPFERKHDSEISLAIKG